MKSPIGFGVAMLATASFAIAGGPGDKKGDHGDKKKGAKKTASTPLADGWSGGPGKGLTFSSDMFSLTLKNRGQVQFNYNGNKGAITPATKKTGTFSGPVQENAGFKIKRARTVLSGHIYSKDITYKLQTDWTNGTSIKDLWIDWRFHNTEKYDIGVQFGQGKIAFGNEWKTSSGSLEFVDRALASRTFTGTRSQGATLHGDMGMGGDGGDVGWSVSAFNTELAHSSRNAGEDGDPRKSTGSAADYNDNSDNQLNWHAGLHWSSKAKAGMGAAQGDNHDGQSAMGAGISFYHGNAQMQAVAGTTPLGPAIDVQTDSGNVWADWKSGNGIAMSAEYFVRAENTVGPNQLGGGASDSNGYQVAATWVAAPVEGQNQWGGGLRYSEIDLPDGQRLLNGGILHGMAGSRARDVEAVINIFHHGHKLKTQLGVTWQTLDPAGAAKNSDNVLVSLQNTFVF